MQARARSGFSDTLKYHTKAESVSGVRATAPSTVECSFNGSDNRSKHAGLRQSLHPDQQHRADLPGCSAAGSRRGPDPVHPGDCRAGVLNLRGNREHDRRPHAQRLQVDVPSKPAGGFVPRILLLALICSALLFPFVSATYVSFNPVGLDPDNLHVYNGTGGLVGIYNTSSTAIYLDPNESYTFLVAPANENLLGNRPDAWFQKFVDKFGSNSVGIILICFCLVILGIAISRNR